MDNRNIASEEAKRWLGTAEKLLAARDLLGAKSFAIRVREAYPRLLDSSAADDVVAVADTLLAGELRINSQPDWYAVLQLPRYTNNLELVASQYRRLALLLNPHRNRLPYSDEAFRLLTEAWSVLSNPSKKVFYDNEFNMFARFDFGGGSTQLHERQFLQRNQHYVHQNQNNQNQNQNQNQSQSQTLFQSTSTSAPHPPPQPQPPPPQQQPQPQFQAQMTPQQQQQTVRKSPRSKDGKAVAEEERPNLNNVAESMRSTRPIESTPPSKATEPTTQTRPAEPTPNSRPVEPTRTSRQGERDGGSFWTACPYCYILYEYPKGYEDCVLRCQKCKRAFHATVIPSPPVGGKDDTYFCCWGFFALGGFPGNAKNSGGWTPFSPMFACPVQDQGTNVAGGGGGGGGGGKGNKNDGSRSPRFIYKDDDGFVEISDESDESDCDWRISKRTTKKAKTSKGKGSAAKTANGSTTERVTRGSQSIGGQVDNAGGADNVDGAASKGPSKGETSRKAKSVASGGKKKGAAEWGKLDLNVEFSNDVEEQPQPAAGMNKGNGAGNGEEDNIEGIGFFEGLDEFLSSLPLLNVVGDDKVKAT